uniref:Uncharacterized protein n=1 Tax=Ditylenchus dipsaci TaxID=166011 RepID=A0A915DEC6_9BILA
MWRPQANLKVHLMHSTKVGNKKKKKEGKAARRSLGAELATGAVETQMRKAAACHSIRALKNFFQRCLRKRFPPLKFMQDLKEEEFKSLHFYASRGRSQAKRRRLSGRHLGLCK